MPRLPNTSFSPRGGALTTNPSAGPSEAELEAVRLAYHLAGDADPQPLVEFARAYACWKQKVGALVYLILVVPKEYVGYMARVEAERSADGAPMSPGWHADMLPRVEAERDRIMATARPGQGTVGMALDIMGQCGDRTDLALLRRLAADKWIPAAPVSPRAAESVRAKRLAERSQADRDADAEANAEFMVGPAAGVVHWTERGDQ